MTHPEAVDAVHVTDSTPMIGTETAESAMSNPDNMATSVPIGKPTSLDSSIENPVEIQPPTPPTAVDVDPVSSAASSASTSLAGVNPPPPPTPAPTPTSASQEPPVVKANEVRTGDGKAIERCQLEDFTSFSKSHLWKLMMSFYDRQGVDSWAQGIVPHFITSNTFIARKYNLLLRAYFRDAMRAQMNQLDPSEPFYIVELGTGSGKFSFYFLKMLADAENILDFPLGKIKYIMTDFTEQNFNFWKKHPALEPFVKRGMVDFAIFDATKDTSLHLECSQQVIEPSGLKNPLCVIANYLFDTLFHDLFQVENGILKEGLISVGSKRAAEADPLDPEIIKRLANVFKYEPIDESYYGEEKEHFNNILKWYHEYYDPASSGATLLVPIGALKALERLAELSSNRLIVLSGDKGNNNPDHFRGVSDPHIAIHGSFSVMVNYHAIGVYFASRGGFALHSPQEEASLKVSLFMLPGTANATSMEPLYGSGLERVSEERSRSYPHVVTAFEEDIVSFGPNDFFVMQKAMKEDAKVPSLKAVISLLKLSGWDPDVFYKFRDVLLDHSPSCSPKLRKDVLHGIPRIWKNYYALDREKDVAFEIGRLYYGIHDYDSALAFYTLSVQEMGKHHVTSHNMGLCHYSKRQLELAASCFEQAYSINSSYQKAATWLQRVKKEMGVAEANSTEGSTTGTPNGDVIDETQSEELAVQQIELMLSRQEDVSGKSPHQSEPVAAMSSQLNESNKDQPSSA